MNPAIIRTAIVAGAMLAAIAYMVSGPKPAAKPEEKPPAEEPPKKEGEAS